MKYIYIYIYIYIYDSKIVHHNPCFNLFILHNIPFDNQGSEINKNDIFLRFCLNFDNYVLTYCHAHIHTQILPNLISKVSRRYEKQL